jgi:hypothetical protein
MNLLLDSRTWKEMGFGVVKYQADCCSNTFLIRQLFHLRFFSTRIAPIEISLISVTLFAKFSPLRCQKACVHDCILSPTIKSPSVNYPLIPPLHHLEIGAPTTLGSQSVRNQNPRRCCRQNHSVKIHIHEAIVHSSVSSGLEEESIP